MKLKQLLSEASYEKILNYDENIEIEALCDNSKTSKHSCIFFAIIGTNTNGANYIDEAIKKGAKAVVISDEKVARKYDKSSTCFIITKNVRKFMAIVSSNFFNKAHKKLKIISVVGTNGKTSTAHILAKIIQFSGRKVGIIGTNGIYIGTEKIENQLTTPDTINLHYLFNLMLQKNIEYVVIEVSAHAIDQYKMYGVVAECSIFTNFSQDHLDYFHTMDNYRNTKIGYFNKQNTKSCIVNVDDEVGKTILSKFTFPTVSYGIKNPSDVFAVNISMNLSGSEFVVNAFDDIYKIKSNLTCLFNIYNLLACIACANFLGISKTVVKKAVLNITEIAGRFNLINLKQNFNLIIDYAHTPESLKSLLTNIKILTKSKIICVFGCPGNRDEHKREIMGQIAGKYSDYCILTSDNPQYENSYRIIRQIESGVYKTGCPYTMIDDRESAISLAISLATPKSTVLIVGKGIENYQLVNGEHISYSDIDACKRQILLAKKLKLDNKFVF